MLEPGDDDGGVVLEQAHIKTISALLPNAVSQSQGGLAIVMLGQREGWSRVPPRHPAIDNIKDIAVEGRNVETLAIH